MDSVWQMGKEALENAVGFGSRNGSNSTDIVTCYATGSNSAEGVRPCDYCGGSGYMITTFGDISIVRFSCVLW